MERRTTQPTQPDPLPGVRGAVSSLRPVRHFLASERFWALVVALATTISTGWVGAVAAARWIEAREADGRRLAALELAQAERKLELTQALQRCHAAETHAIGAARELAAQWARARARPAKRDRAADDARAHFDRLVKDGAAPAAALRTAVEALK